MRLEVLSPVARKMEKQGALAPRVTQLEGKAIGLYWNLKSGGDVALKHAGERLKAKFPGVQTKLYTGAIEIGRAHV